MTKQTISVWILGDQLAAQHPALAAAEREVGRENCRVVMVESAQRLAKRPYQRKKLVLLLSAMRHYAQRLEAAGYAVDYVRADTFAQGLQRHVAKVQPHSIFTMAAADYGGRGFQNDVLPQVLALPVRVLPNTQMILGRFDPYPQEESQAKRPKQVIMEHFYRAMRKHFRVLMTADDSPEGGAWNFDKKNRKPLPKGGVGAPLPVTFDPDELTQSVMEEVARMPQGLGKVEGFTLAVTHEQAEAAFDDFVRHRLADFGPLEDAMSRVHTYLYHSALAAYLNLGLLEPMALVERAERAYRDGLAPIQSVEGFIRQILGWREYIYWQYWRQMPAMLGANSWEHGRPLPRLFWDGATDMACLRHVVERVIEQGYSHHIERLMVICNFCMLAGIEPGQVNEWFLSFYNDAYEWVVTPNVIGMGLNADGGKTATKPYIASANYINKMSDYCGACRFDPGLRTGHDACPFNYLYWNFLLSHEEKLRSNPRFGPAVLGLRHLDEETRQEVAQQAAAFLRALA